MHPTPEQRLTRFVAYVRRLMASMSRRASQDSAFPGTDIVGYEAIIAQLHAWRIFDVPGDMIEIGTFLGGGARKLADELQRHAPAKTLFVIDVFDPTLDVTANQSGKPMASFYAEWLKRYAGRSQRDIYDEVVQGRANIRTITGDSARVTVPATSFCFGFVDGNHDPAYVRSDFALVWDRLAAGGAVGLHDYGWDLPQVTSTIDALIHEHTNDIVATLHDQVRKIMYIRKRSAPAE